MRKRVKKSLALLLVLCMIVSLAGGIPTFVVSAAGGNAESAEDEIAQIDFMEETETMSEEQTDEITEDVMTDETFAAEEVETEGILTEGELEDKAEDSEVEEATTGEAEVVEETVEDEVVEDETAEDETAEETEAEIATLSLEHEVETLNASGTSGAKSTDVSTVTARESGINVSLFDYNDTDPNGNINTSVQAKGLDSYFKYVGSLDYIHTAGLGLAADKYGEGFIQGMVSNKLVNGYPYLLTDYHAQDSKVSNGSLGFLFGDGSSPYVTSYKTNNGLFWKDAAGYYEYNSDEHAVDYDPATNRFYVRNYMETCIMTAARGLAAGATGEHDFLPFNYSDGIVLGQHETTGKDYYFTEDETNYWFGMKIDTAFEQPKDGKVTNAATGELEDMVFDFTGDDDVWLYIDGVLVLDMGGTHAASSGKINFATGEITYTSYKPENNQGLNTDGTGGTGWDETLGKYTIKECFEEAGVEAAFNGNTFADYTSHRIDYFYMERGSCSSACHITFNIPTMPTEKLAITKDVENMHSAQVDQESYSLKLYVETAKESGEYRVQSGGYVLRANGEETNINTAADGTFTLKDGETAVFDVPLGRKYYVQEVSTGNAAYNVTFNAEEVQILEKSDDTVESDSYLMVEDGVEDTITVTNSLIAGNIKVTKIFELDGTTIEAPAGFEANFALYDEDDLENPMETAAYSAFTDGSYTFENLLPGKYIVKEESADGNPLIGKEYTIKLDGKTYTIVQSGPEQMEVEVEVDGSEQEIAAVSMYNDFEHKTQTLTVSKTVTGENADLDKYFQFQMRFTRDGQFYAADIEGAVNEGNGTYTFNLKHEGSVTFDVPYGYTYTVTEVNVPENYTTTVSVNGGEAQEAVTASGVLEEANEVAFVNSYKKPTSTPTPTPTPSGTPTPTPSTAPTPTPTPTTTNTIKTGDSANIILWVSLLGLSTVCCAVVFMMKRRKNNN